MRKTTGNSDSQQILLDHSLSINQKKKKQTPKKPQNQKTPKEKNFTYRVQKTKHNRSMYCYCLETYGNAQEHSVLSFHQKICTAEDRRHT